MKCHWWLQLSPNVPKEDKTFQHIYNSRSTPFTKIYCSSCLGSGQKRYGKAYDKKLQKNSMASKHKHLKALVFPYTFEESVDCHLLSSFCDDSNLHISFFKYLLSTMDVSKESISKFLIGNRFHLKLRILSPSSDSI